MPLPTFIIIGTMKGGTTSLFNYLAAQPDVVTSSIKETDYFAKNHDRGMAWYESLFAEPGDSGVVGEASPNYTKRHLWPDTAERIAATVPEARLIFLARDPVDRFYSHVVHNYAHGRERRPIPSLIAPDSNYVRTSMYAYQLEPYFDRFASDRLLVLDSLELRNDTAGTVRRVLDFIGSDSTVAPNVVDERHHRSSDKLRRSPVERHVRSPFLRAVLKRILPARMTRPQPFERPVFSDEAKAQLCALLADDAATFRSQVGLDFSHWSV